VKEPRNLMADLLALRAQLGRTERAQREAALEARRAPRPTNIPLKPLKPQREADLSGVNTDDFQLARAHARMREAVYEGRYHICAHAVGHARAEGFLEHDIMAVLLAGRVRAVYPDERRWLVAGYFEACGVALPLHVVVEVHAERGPGGPSDFLDVVTAFVPRHPHHIISRARLAVMLRYDDEKVQHRLAPVASKTGNKSKGKWRKGA
jgi:hypothetical protein